MLTLKILGAVAALLLGVWLGLPGRYQRDLREIDKVMDRGGRERKKVRRMRTPLDWFRKDPKGSDRRRRRRHFKTAAPDRRND